MRSDPRLTENKIYRSIGSHFFQSLNEEQDVLGEHQEVLDDLDEVE